VRRVRVQARWLATNGAETLCASRIFRQPTGSTVRSIWQFRHSTTPLFLAADDETPHGSWRESTRTIMASSVVRCDA
jgi:hypothetical protein